MVEAVTRALAEDLLPLGDLSAALLPSSLVASGTIVAREPGVLAGTGCATESFAQVDPAVIVEWSAEEGEALSGGQVLATVSGPFASILTAERTALNFLGHLSGIATRTRTFVDRARQGGPAQVWDTRKTTPGLRSLEKAAVRAGGGANHRGNLSDWVMLKDNHLAVLGVAEGIERARRAWPARTIHVECDRLDQVREAVGAGADALLLDNMTPAQVRSAMELIAGADPRPLVEVSGGVTLDTIEEYAALGVDCISIGGLTNSAPVLDIGLDVGPR